MQAFAFYVGQAAVLLRRLQRFIILDTEIVIILSYGFEGEGMWWKALNLPWRKR
ncbi:MAG: hypothetical protein IRF6MM_06820 [Candidatus Midichloria mitochondrii]